MCNYYPCVHAWYKYNSVVLVIWFTTRIYISVDCNKHQKWHNKIITLNHIEYRNSLQFHKKFLHFHLKCCTVPMNVCSCLSLESCALQEPFPITSGGQLRAEADTNTSTRTVLSPDPHTHVRAHVHTSHTKYTCAYACVHGQDRQVLLQTYRH